MRAKIIRCAVVIALLCSACDSIFLVELPRDRAFESYLLAIDSAGTLQVHVAGRADPPVDFIARNDARLELLLYDRPLSELGLTPGPLASDPAADPRRSVPVSDAHYFGARDDRRITWSRNGELSEQLRTFRFKTLDIPTCLREGGCLGAAADITGEHSCVRPCPEPPSPEPPAPPDPRIERPILPSLPATPTAPGFDLDCAPGEARFFGDPGCARVGDVCPTTDFVEVPAPGILFVRASTIAGGDGSLANPFSTIAGAIAAARLTGASTIALARGDYPDRVILDLPITLRGACVRDTHLRAGIEVSAGEVENLSAAGITVTGRARLENIFAQANIPEIIEVREGGILRANNILVRGNSIDAFVARGNTDIDISRMIAAGGTSHTVRAYGDLDRPSRVRLTDLIAVAEGPSRQGVAVLGAVDAELARILVTRHEVIGFRVHASPGATLRAAIEDVFVRDIGGPDVAHGAQLFDIIGEAKRISIDNVGGNGLQIFDTRARVSVSDLTIARARRRAYQLAGGEIRLDRVLIEDAGPVDVSTVKSATIADLTVRRRSGVDKDTIHLFQTRNLLYERAFYEVGTRPTIVATEARARFVDLTFHREEVELVSMIVAAGSNLSLERAFLDGCDGQCVHVVNGGSVTANHLAIGRVRTTTITNGAQVLYADNAELSCSHFEIHEPGISALHAAGAGVQLSDAVLDGAWIYTARGSTLTIDRAKITGGTANAINIEDTSVTFRDVEIARAAPDSVQVYGRSDASFTRVSIDDSAGYGLTAKHQSIVTGTDVTIGRVLIGVRSLEGGTVRFDRFRIYDAERAAIDVDADSSATFTAGTIEDNGIGALLPALDPRWFRPLSERVLYRGNDSNFAPR